MVFQKVWAYHSLRHHANAQERRKQWQRCSEDHAWWAQVGRTKQPPSPADPTKSLGLLRVVFPTFRLSINSGGAEMTILSDNSSRILMAPWRVEGG